MAMPRPHSHPFVPYRPPRVPAEEGLRRGQRLHDLLDQRRSVRFFSSDPVPREAIELAVRTANTAPSGAHQQPWTFVAVRDAEVKHRIRLAAEAEERAFYGRDDIPEWHGALARLETGADKDYLDVVPWIVVVFAQKYSVTGAGRQKHYYVNESVGIACGMFISSLHAMGLATLTHTPNPMGFLTKILERPSSERPYIVFPIGYPAPDCEVPDLARKPLDQALVHYP
ncbi:nitroreductase family protein [Saccharopolyspora taberi]|uniref:Nitroreductase family protein n=1 Tax=Saccharopolyspora taberi TaxID=60895 RepID=A0ABN3V683_9PSEU